MSCDMGDFRNQNPKKQGEFWILPTEPQVAVEKCGQMPGQAQVLLDWRAFTKAC